MTEETEKNPMATAIRAAIRPQVARALKEAGAIADAADILEVEVLNGVVVQEDGTFRTGGINRDGTDSSIEELVANMRRAKPSLFAPQTPAPIDFVAANAAFSRPSGMSFTQWGIAQNAHRSSAGGQSARAAELVRKAVDDGNPYKPGRHYNMTRQAIIAKNDPALAARLRKEADQ